MFRDDDDSIMKRAVADDVCRRRKKSPLRGFGLKGGACQMCVMNFVTR